VVLFRFSETGPSAIGFVAWLHSAEDGQDRRHRDLRQELFGSEKLFEVCQGAMDYWACPQPRIGSPTSSKTLIQKGSAVR